MMLWLISKWLIQKCYTNVCYSKILIKHTCLPVNTKLFLKDIYRKTTHTTKTNNLQVKTKLKRNTENKTETNMKIITIKPLRTKSLILFNSKM